MADKPETKGSQPALEAYWGKADHLEPVLVDNLHLQRVNNQYYLTFGQIRLPLVEAPTERVVAEIRPMTRLIIPRDALRRIVELLSRTLKHEE